MGGGSLVISGRLWGAPRTENQMMQHPFLPALLDTDADRELGTVGGRMQRQQSRALSLRPLSSSDLPVRLCKDSSRYDGS
jgi:hypothetical protein